MLASTIREIKQLIEQPESLLTICDESTIDQAAKKMSDHHIGCLVVIDKNDKFVGVISERDMLSKVLTQSSPSDEVPVRNVMTSDVISCSMDTAVDKVERLMAKHNIRHLPIVENDRPIGMISSRDIIAYRLKGNQAMKAAAEQLAMLSTGLKSLDFEDVVTLAINEVPKSFGAERAVLCFSQKDGSEPIVYRNGCPHSPQELLNLKEMGKISESGQIVSNGVCKDCANFEHQMSRLIIPLKIHDQCNGRYDESKSLCGFLCMCRSDVYTSEPDESLLYKASLLQEVLSINLTNAKLYQNYQQARRDSEVDPLTGVGTRRVLEKVLKAECARAARYHRVFSVAIVDLDNFKRINDTAGHAAGDRTLKRVVKVIRHNIRETDIIIARYGGDEFVLLMPETKTNGARVLLERIRRQIKTVSIPKVNSATISCGVAEWNDSPPDTSETIMSRADAALYEAKRNGRNRVVVHELAENKV